MHFTLGTASYFDHRAMVAQWSVALEFLQIPLNQLALELAQLVRRRDDPASQLDRPTPPPASPAYPVTDAQKVFVRGPWGAPTAAPAA